MGLPRVEHGVQHFRLDTDAGRAVVLGTEGHPASAQQGHRREPERHAPAQGTRLDLLAQDRGRHRRCQPLLQDETRRGVDHGLGPAPGAGFQGSLARARDRADGRVPAADRRRPARSGRGDREDSVGQDAARSDSVGRRRSRRDRLGFTGKCRERDDAAPALRADPGGSPLLQRQDRRSEHGRSHEGDARAGARSGAQGRVGCVPALRPALHPRNELQHGAEPDDPVRTQVRPDRLAGARVARALLVGAGRRARAFEGHRALGKGL